MPRVGNHVQVSLSADFVRQVSCADTGPLGREEVIRLELSQFSKTMN